MLDEAMRLSRIRILSGLAEEDVDDITLALWLEITEIKVKNFCHRKDIPDELALVIDEMVARLATKIVEDQTARDLENEPSARSVESIKRGDTTISYDTSSSSSQGSKSVLAYVDPILLDFKRQLYVFRKVGTL